MNARCAGVQLIPASNHRAMRLVFHQTSFWHLTCHDKAKRCQLDMFCFHDQQILGSSLPYGRDTILRQPLLVTSSTRGRSPATTRPVSAEDDPNMAALSLLKPKGGVVRWKS